MTLLEFFTGFITVFENPVWDWIVGGVLVSASSGIAYAIGGKLGYSGKVGKVLWLLTAIFVYAIIACVIRGVIWLISLPWWAWAVVGIVIIAAAIIMAVRKY